MFVLASLKVPEMIKYMYLPYPGSNNWETRCREYRHVRSAIARVSRVPERAAAGLPQIVPFPGR